MTYGIFDLELTEPLPELTLGHYTGVALVIRRKGRLMGFLMDKLRSATLDRAMLVPFPV